MSYLNAPQLASPPLMSHRDAVEGQWKGHGDKRACPRHSSAAASRCFNVPVWLPLSFPSSFFFFFLETRVLARAAVCWDLLQYRVYRLGSVSGSCCCDTAFPISSILHMSECPEKSRRGAQVLHGAPSSNQMVCMVCESSLNAFSSPSTSVPMRKTLPKSQVWMGKSTPILSRYVFLLWRIEKYVKDIFHAFEENIKN